MNPPGRYELPPEAGLRDYVQFYLVDSRTPLGKIIDVTIIVLNLLICALYVVETYPITNRLASVLWQIEVVVVFFFVVEYAARIYGARRRLKHVFSFYSIIDLVAILPTLSELVLPTFGLALNISFIRTLRVLRVFRIFRFLRFTMDADFFFGRITMSLLRVLRLGLTILIIFFVSSGLFYHVENAVNGRVGDFGDAFYYTVVTLTTVGFGDIIPVSPAGRWVTVLMILSGIVLIPWQVGQMVREWLRMSNKSDVTCPSCGLRFHDRDASHCKSCGHVIYQVYEAG